MKSSLLIALFGMSVTAYSTLELEAERGTGYPVEAQRSRHNASNGATVLLNEGQSVTMHFNVLSSCNVSAVSIFYTNDGGSDNISVAIDKMHLGSFLTVGESNFGNGWNVVRSSEFIGNSVSVTLGLHTIQVIATATDQYGFEVDKLTIKASEHCTTNILCTNPSNSDTSSRTCDISSTQSRIEQKSVVTNCAEEDNIHVPIYYDHVRKFTITASAPEYASLTRANSREANFTNCKMTSKTIWMIGKADMSSNEFSGSCSSLSSIIHANSPTTDICGKLNNEDQREMVISFKANGVSTGQVESSIGSLVNLQFVHVNGFVVVEAAVYGRLKTWISIGQMEFNATSKSSTWQIPDFTWTDGENNMVRLAINSTISSRNAVGAFDYIKLEKRPETGEFEIAEIYNDGITVVKAIGKDFWWLSPQSMILRNSRNDLRWSNVVYIRVLKKIPSVDSWPEVFVLYQDGNSRILNFPPLGVDWIPFGSSVIIGQSDPNSVRPHAAISQIDFDPTTLKFTLHFTAGGNAIVDIQTSISSTIVTVNDIKYATDTSLPFATFRSMWVGDGNSDVDHVRIAKTAKHIMNDGWSTLTGNSVLFFRTCVSQHNTLSPDIRVEVQCFDSGTQGKVLAPYSMVIMLLSFLLYVCC